MSAQSDTEQEHPGVRERLEPSNRAQEAPRTLRQNGSTPASNSPAPIQTGSTRVGRNDPCPCGSGKTHKKCHGGVEPPVDEKRKETVAQLSAELRHDPHLLDTIGATMTRRGYAGDVRPPLTVYVAATSRHLDRPNNVIVLAESAVGKNATVDAAIELHPPEAVYAVSAASPKSLVYIDDEDFRHRHVFFKEADSIPEDGPAGTIFRSLAADNVMSYDVTEQVTEVDPETDERKTRYKTRHIEIEGPTGLITTSTKSLGHQLSTRMLEVSLSDDAVQTFEIMLAHARHANPRAGEPEIDLAPFVAFQQWIAEFGEHRVIVPYSEVLAHLVPSAAVRMRRDFKQLLTFIQAIALLYQSQRERTPDGAIIATVDDYAEARKLLAPLFDAVIAAGLTPTIRETVEVIRPSETNVSEVEVAKRLKQAGTDLNKSTISYRVNRAIEKGWLINDEWRKGQLARLRRGTPLPDADTALPAVENVRELFELPKAV